MVLKKGGYDIDVPLAELQTLAAMHRVSKEVHSISSRGRTVKRTPRKESVIEEKNSQINIEGEPRKKTRIKIGKKELLPPLKGSWKVEVSFLDEKGERKINPFFGNDYLDLRIYGDVEKIDSKDSSIHLKGNVEKLKIDHGISFIEGNLVKDLKNEGGDVTLKKSKIETLHNTGRLTFGDSSSEED